MAEKPTFNVSQLLKDPLGASRHVQVDADLRTLGLNLPQVEADAEQPEMLLHGPLRLMHINDGVLVQGDLNAEVILPCSRCLDPVQVPLEVPVEEIFHPTIDIATGQAVQPEEDDRALWIDEHHILDLSEVLRQDVLVELPLHVLCREDCKGLCPTCGKNLNEGPCDCAAETDPRWAGLQQLLRDNHTDSDPSEKE